MTAPFRFGLIGAGGIAATHADALAASEVAELVAVAAGRQAGEFAARHGCDHELEPEALLARSDLDGVILCTPSGARLELALAAAERGKHVLVEKPLEVTVARSRTMIEACAAAGVTLGVIFQSRFAPGVAAAAAAVRAGALGTPVLGEIQVAWYRPPSYYASGAWRGTHALDGGGALMNQGIHAVDQLLWLMGDATFVAARSTRRLHTEIEVEDLITAQLTFASGALGTLSASTACAPGWARRTEACGTAGSIRLVDDTIERWDLPNMPDPREAQQDGGHVAAPDRDAGPPAGTSSPTVAGSALHQAQIDDFVQAVRTGRAPRVDGREGLRSVALVEAAYRSAAADGRPVGVEV